MSIWHEAGAKMEKNIYKNSTTPFPLLLKNSIRKSLSQKLLPKTWYGNFQNSKNGEFLLCQSILQKAQAKNKKNNLVTELHCFLFYKKNSIRSFLSKKNEPKSCPQKHILAFSRSKSKL